MDEEQKRKFEEWWNGCSKYYSIKQLCSWAWNACLEANKVEEQEPEQTPTEMVRRLLEKGWEIESDGNDIVIFRHPDCVFASTSVIRAYRKAFPPKKRVEVKAWICSHCMRTYWANDFVCHTGSRMVEGIATFWLEEEQ